MNRRSDRISDRRLGRARRIVAEATGVDEETVPDSAAIGTWAPWDSLAHMRIVLATEERLGRQIPIEDVLALSDIAGLSDIIERLSDKTV